MKKSALWRKIEKILEDVQPALGMHGGSIELVNIRPEKVVELRFKGACVGCSAADRTLEYGLREMLMIQLEEIQDVVAVNRQPTTHLPPHFNVPSYRP